MRCVAIKHLRTLFVLVSVSALLIHWNVRSSIVYDSKTVGERYWNENLRTSSEQGQGWPLWFIVRYDNGFVSKLSLLPLDEGIVYRRFIPINAAIDAGLAAVIILFSVIISERFWWLQRR